MENLKVRECVLSGYVLNIKKSKPNVTIVNLKTRNFHGGELLQNGGIPIIVNGDINWLNVDDPVAFIGYIVPDKFNTQKVCMMAYSDRAFIPKE